MRKKAGKKHSWVKESLERREYLINVFRGEWKERKFDKILDKGEFIFSSILRQHLSFNKEKKESISDTFHMCLVLAELAMGSDEEE